MSAWLHRVFPVLSLVRDLLYYLLDAFGLFVHRAMEPDAFAAYPDSRAVPLMVISMTAELYLAFFDYAVGAAPTHWGSRGVSQRSRGMPFLEVGLALNSLLLAHFTLAVSTDWKALCEIAGLVHAASPR